MSQHESKRRLLRRYFGYHMELLITRHYAKQSELVLSTAKYDKRRAIRFSKKLCCFYDKVAECSSFEIKKEKHLKNKTNSLTDLFRENQIEFMRIEDGEITVSEIKSRFEENDHRILFEFNQARKLIEIFHAGINVTLIYCIALPTPVLVEVPFQRIVLDLKNALKTKNRVRIRLPIEYRDKQKFTSLRYFNYSDEKSLIEHLESMRLLNIKSLSLQCKSLSQQTILNH